PSGKAPSCTLIAVRSNWVGNSPIWQKDRTGFGTAQKRLPDATTACQKPGTKAFLPGKTDMCDSCGLLIQTRPPARKPLFRCSEIRVAMPDKIVRAILRSP